MHKMLKVPRRLPPLSYPVKCTVIGAAVGVALITVLASYFRRRRRRPLHGYLNLESEDQETNSVSSVSGIIRAGGVHQIQSPATSLPQHDSNASIVTSDSSNMTLTAIDTSGLTPEQLCDLGLESMQLAIDHWELALERLQLTNHGSEGGNRSEELSLQLHALLERAYRFQNEFQHHLFSQMNANLAVDTAVQAITEMDRAFNERRSSRGSLNGTSTDADSFVSATDLADLTDLEEHVEEFQHLVLYEAGLLELKHGTVPYRTLRTRMVNCMSDIEFLAKLHCLRLALQELFKDSYTRNFFITAGRQMIADLLVKAERDPEEFLVAFDDMFVYIGKEENQADMEEELRGRGVKEISFYDIVIDFILFDAFEDLENPPSSVTSVVQNRWLSNGFKETALSTAVWSVLKAKRRMLKFPRGFISHFYSISEHVSPMLAWGFLGPPGKLKDLCIYFRDQVLAFMRDVFDFEKVHYTTIEELADDILRLARDRIAIASAKLAS